MTKQKQVGKKQEHAANAVLFYAACQAGHPFWNGPDQPTQQKAQENATEHDNARHGGSPTASGLY